MVPGQTNPGICKTMKHILLTACLIFAAHAAFCKDDSASTSQPSSTAPEGFSGKVVETLNAGDYTYVMIDTGKGTNCAAAPRFAVKVGDTATVPASMPMPKYHSKILNRDFDVVYFTDKVLLNGEKSGQLAQLPKDHPPIDGAQMPELPKNHPPIGAAAAKADLDFSGIKKADGGKTVAEVYSDKTKLSGKQVKIRGKVVKYNANIMGKNWLHLRDGTGKDGSNDLLVTSTSQAKVGSTVLVTGVVAVNRDFGANYKYPVVVEDAKVTAE